MSVCGLSICIWIVIQATIFSSTSLMSFFESKTMSFLMVNLRTKWASWFLPVSASKTWSVKCVTHTASLPVSLYRSFSLRERKGREKDGQRERERVSESVCVSLSYWRQQVLSLCICTHIYKYTHVYMYFCFSLSLSLSHSLSLSLHLYLYK